MSDPKNIKSLGGYHPPLDYVAGQVAQGDYIYSIDENSLNQQYAFLHVLPCQRSSNGQRNDYYPGRKLFSHALVLEHGCGQ